MLLQSLKPGGSVPVPWQIVLTPSPSAPQVPWPPGRRASAGLLATLYQLHHEADLGLGKLRAGGARHGACFAARLLRVGKRPWLPPAASAQQGARCGPFWLPPRAGEPVAAVPLTDTLGEGDFAD